MIFFFPLGEFRALGCGMGNPPPPFKVLANPSSVLSKRCEQGSAEFCKISRGCAEPVSGFASIYQLRTPLCEMDRRNSTLLPQSKLAISSTIGIQPPLLCGMKGRVGFKLLPVDCNAARYHPTRGGVSLIAVEERLLFVRPWPLPGRTGAAATPKIGGWTSYASQ